jgi:hypothetical protein
MAGFEEELAAEIANLVRQHVKPLRDRIEVLEKQAAEFKYCGVWREGESYRKNNFVTHHGGVWAALCDTEAKPGQSLQWQLAVQKGRDARTERKPAA